MKKFWFIFIFTITAIAKLNAQYGDTLYIAEELIYNEDFTNAIRFYQRLIAMDPKNPDFWFKLGFCYLNTDGKRDSSIHCFNNALKLIKKKKKWWKKIIDVQVSREEVLFYLGRAYRSVGMYDSAIYVLNSLKKQVKNKKFLKLIDKELEKTKVGEKLTSNPLKVNVVNLGPKINSKYSEHTPVFTADESELYFTSRRKLFPDSEPDYDGEYDENIYMSVRDSMGQWSDPVPVMELNTPNHEATICLSYDGTKLFIYKSEDDGSIFYSELKNGKWQPPKKLGKNINTKYRETHASLSIDGKTLYFTSDRPGGYGGLDIYKSELQPDGTWGKAINLGPTINTPEDEEGPYIAPDNRTLYFSSAGHETMGGLDIFKSVLQDDGTWSEPENLGYPINSIKNDAFYFPTVDGKRAYFASEKEDSYGKTDIYLMYIPNAKESNVVVYWAKLIFCDKDSIENPDILITDLTKDQSYPVTPKKDKFLFIGYKGHKLKVLIEYKNQVVYTDTFTIPKQEQYIKFYKRIKIDPRGICEGKKIEDTDTINPKLTDAYGQIYDKYVELENILFPLNKAGEIKENATLDTLAQYLKENPGAVIEIIGYCDASGKASYNYILGLKRAYSVKKYLVSKGVNPSQLVITSYGEENPIAINKNPDGTWNPEGQKYNRRVEFRVLKQGKTTLLIWQMKIPEELRNPHYKFNYKKDPNKHIEINY